MLSEHIRSILWKLAYKQLGPEDWKKLALHWAFTNDQIRAIEHQYTGKIKRFVNCFVRIYLEFEDAIVVRNHRGTKGIHFTRESIVEFEKNLFHREA